MPAVHRYEKLCRPIQPLLDRTADLASDCHQCSPRIPAKFKRKQMVGERLFAIAAVVGKLCEYFALPDWLQFIEGRSPGGQLRPACRGNNQPCQFPEEMVVRRGT